MAEDCEATQASLLLCYLIVLCPQLMFELRVVLHGSIAHTAVSLFYGQPKQGCAPGLWLIKPATIGAR